MYDTFFYGSIGLKTLIAQINVDRVQVAGTNVLESRRAASGEISSTSIYLLGAKKLLLHAPLPVYYSVGITSRHTNPDRLSGSSSTCCKQSKSPVYCISHGVVVDSCVF